jgi:hypothetical protein
VLEVEMLCDAALNAHLSCLANSIGPECSYYELEVSFDLSGVYLAQVFYFAPDDTTLVKMGDVLRFEVRGFGEVTLPVPPPSASMANQLTDVELPLFDTALSQTVRDAPTAHPCARMHATRHHEWTT